MLFYILHLERKKPLSYSISLGIYSISLQSINLVCFSSLLSMKRCHIIKNSPYQLSAKYRVLLSPRELLLSFLQPVLGLWETALDFHFNGMHLFSI